MPKRYFDLSADMTLPGRWSLGIPTDQQGREVDDPWAFKKGQPIPNPGRLRVPIDVPGTAFDFTLAGLATPIVHVRVASLLTELATDDVQIFPVDIAGQPDQFCILVATKLIRCINDAACKEVELWRPEDGRPEKAGQYRDVYGMRIDAAKVGEANVFRTWGWSVALIVSEEIKSALARIGATGMRFNEV
ncbi:hypothetical protein [Corallococcus llansteffanensis]|uniref:Uncharacterized protein n=1 Tax=Corallococcus llansteffanensis TaxID=2316731 RepID=A0A3A8PKA6_9BACT|nr:hypothetical protein [Corallococcus llansteffanensis]RKH56773.1 hypothetical protein D7V93_19685 [Corallococcus llansteffanensis]